MLLTLFFVLAICFFTFGPLADLLFHIWHIGTVYRGSELHREIALTFDDGPHPEYTPELMQLLDEHQVQAVFFIIGENAKRYPDIVKNIHERGHIVASHTFHHHNAWLQSPWHLRKEVTETTRVLTEITGAPVCYFRPPWGRFQLFLPAILRRAKQIPVLWTFATQDWKSGDNTAMIAKTIMAKAQNGAIILLHDNGGAPGAPAHTIRALRQTLPKLRKIGFTCNARPVTNALAAKAVRRGSFPRRTQRIIHPLWSLWETLFDRIYHVYPMTRLFRLSIVPWRFGPRMHAEQTTPKDFSTLAHIAAASEPTLAANVPMVELHLQNLVLQELVKIESPEKMAIRAIRELRNSLRDVALILVSDERFQHAQGVFGMTLLHRGIDKLGFHVEPVPQTISNRWVGLLLTSIMVLYHPKGKKRLQIGLGEMTPRLMWMGKQEFLARYLPPDSHCL